MSDEPAAVAETGRVRIVREFPVQLAEGDGRTIEATIVPYNEPAVVADPPDFVSYREEWMPGAFEKQTGVAGSGGTDRVKVWLNFEHEQGLRGVIGHGVELQDDGGALRGVFRVHGNADGDKALQLVHEGLLSGISLEAVAIRSRKTAGGVVQRLRAHLDGVALCRFPAYKSAQVLAVREEPAVLVDPTTFMPAENAALVQRLEALGVQPLARIAIVKTAWDGSASRFTDAEYAASCLVDRGGGGAAKVRCSLPVLEPDGALNVNALGPAASRLSSLPGVSPAMKAAAARKLLRYYRMASMDAPNSVTKLAAT